MAKAVFEVAREVDGADVGLYQIQETFTSDVLEKMGATESKKSFEHIPVATVENLSEADAIIFGTPTRFGMMAAQMRAFLDRAGGIWSKSEVAVDGVFFAGGVVNHFIKNKHF
ncbi:NAD(P)H-dependent oxidoreductase [Methanolobus sp. ZRKC4]|uniref:NAD(P)H-dependent oxidoreductase n=1 Tax=unclassified Methanolobus TaxID=2629569 RepID=UPI003872EE9B